MDSTSRRDTASQTEHLWVEFSHSLGNQSRYAFARKNNNCTGTQARASEELVQGILSSVGKRASWMDTSYDFTLEGGDANDIGKDANDSWEGSFNSADSSNQDCSGDHQEAPSILWLKQYKRREVGHCFEEYGKVTLLVQEHVFNVQL